jgi:hypothetical protein
VSRFSRFHKFRSQPIPDSLPLAFRIVSGGLNAGLQSGRHYGREPLEIESVTGDSDSGFSVCWHNLAFWRIEYLELGPVIPTG